MDINGKTIQSHEFLKVPNYDDTAWLRLNFTDGTACLIESGYDEYTGDSLEEYPVRIRILPNSETVETGYKIQTKLVPV